MPWGPADVGKALGVLLALGGAGAGGVLAWSAIGRPGGRLALMGGLAAVELMLLPAVWLFGVRRAGGSWQSLGFRPFKVGQAISLIGLILFLAVAANVAYAGLMSALGLRQLLPPSPRQLFGVGQANLVVALLLVSGVAPVAEEAFFRGFVFPGLARQWGAVPGAVGSSLLFGVFHASLGALAPITALGLLLTWLYARTGSIWPSIVLHGMYNAAGVLAVVVTQGELR